MIVLLQTLLHQVDVVAQTGTQFVQVCGLCDDSRQIEKGQVFFALKTARFDANEVVDQVLEQGAVAVVSSQPRPDHCLCGWVQVSDVVQARYEMAKAFFENPFGSLRCHGVTGTNGKTTITFIMAQMLEKHGCRVALLGTVENRIAEQRFVSHLTTPGILELYAFAHQAVQDNCTDLVMEVSSHAIDQNRIAGIEFASALFTNLSRDHLDYHHNMETYFDVKTRLFTEFCSGDSFVLVGKTEEKKWGNSLAETLTALHQSCVRVSMDDVHADLYVERWMNEESGLMLQLNGSTQGTVHSVLRGDFNAENILLTVAWALQQGFVLDEVNEALQQVLVPGRFEMVYDLHGIHVVVDYAHTPDALERVLQTARQLCQKKLHVVFGCGGDRDHGKRALMAKAASQIADVCWVTSDNPRSEDPQKILDDILEGLNEKTEHYENVDRRQMIQKACDALQEGDWLIVAGKGHEDYQLIGHQKLHFDDREEIRNVMQERMAS